MTIRQQILKAIETPAAARCDDTCALCENGEHGQCDCPCSEAAVNGGKNPLYDYDKQAWTAIVNRARCYIRCGHPESMACGCYGRAHAGEQVHGLDVHRILAQNGIIR